MILTSQNIQEWKKKLDSEMYRQFGISDYSKTLSDSEWLESNEGDTVQNAIDSEIDCWGV